MSPNPVSTERGQGQFLDLIPTLPLNTGVLVPSTIFPLIRKSNFDVTTLPNHHLPQSSDRL